MKYLLAMLVLAACSGPSDSDKYSAAGGYISIDGYVKPSANVKADSMKLVLQSDIDDLEKK